MSYNPEIQLEKSIFIDPAKIGQDAVLPSDEYVEKERGERNAPSLVKMQEAVDYETAARLAAAKGVQLQPQTAPLVQLNQQTYTPPPVSGKDMSKSKLPREILESFAKQPPMAPTMPAPEFNPEFLAKVKDHNERVKNVMGENKTHAKSVGNIREEYIPAQQPQMPRTYTQTPQSGQVIDYSLIRMIIAESVKDALKDVNIKEIVKEVLKEEREEQVKKNVNENIEIKFGNTILSGKVNLVKSPKK